MEFNSNTEKILYNYCLRQPKLLQKVDKRGFFENDQIDTIFYLTKRFYEKFNQSPSKEQVKLLVQNSSAAQSKKINDTYIDAVFDINLGDYDNQWLDQTAVSWIKWRTFDISLIDTIEWVKSQSIKPESVEHIINKAKDIVNERNNINFDKDLGLDFFNPEDHVQHAEEKISTGLDFVDRITYGGYDKCSLVVYAGEQNIGKSIWLANDAVNFVKRGHNTAVITAEMAAHKFIKRLGANSLNVKVSEYDQKSKDPAFIKRRLETMGNGLMPPGQLFIKKFPTSQATVIDIENYLLDLEKARGIKLKAVVIDYINILANYRNPNSENTYMKIKQIAEDLRGMADRNGWLIITATQIKRSGYDAADITMDDISESAGLSHTADMIYAIIQTSEMHVAHEYFLKVLKVRDGEGKNTRCKFTINYDYMRLNETSEVSTTESF